MGSLFSLNCFLETNSVSPAAGSLHLYSKERLFDRAILLSGLAGLLPPRPIDAQHAAYLDLCQKLGITTKDPSERSKQLLEADAVEIGNQAFAVQTVPTADGNFIPTTEWIRHENFHPKPEWCKELTIGSCRDEVNIRVSYSLPLPPNWQA